MSKTNNHVYVVSEWLAKPGKEQAMIACFKELLATTSGQEEGCVSAKVTHQIQHPGSPSQSKFTVVLMQEYKSTDAFTLHCETEYVKNFFKENIEELVEDWRCRLFEEI